MRDMTDGDWDVSGCAALVVASSEGCGPCRKMAPVLEDLEAEWYGRVELARAEVGSCPRELERLGVRSVPTMVLFVEGEEVGRWTGLMDKAKLRAEVEAALALAE